MAFFGLDIGSYSVKMVSADGHGAAAKLKKLGSVYNPVGQALPSDKGQLEQLAAAIKNGVREHGLSGQNCHLALPGPQAYISIVSMPVLSDAELSSAIKWEAEQHIPVSLAEVNFEYDVIYRPAKGSAEDEMVVFMVGAPKATVERYLSLLEMVGVEPIGLEPEVVALTRSFFAKGDPNEQVATLICNFGALSSSFVVVDRGRIAVAHSAPIGSLALTRALEKGLTLDPSQSEEYKRTYGLEVDKLEGRVRTTLLPVFDSVVREIRKTIQFFISKDPGAHRVGRVIMAGGGSNLPGMVGYLAEILSVEVLVGDPLKNFGGQVGQISDAASYAVAAGLAVKEF